MTVRSLTGEQLYAAQMLGAFVSILLWADKANRRPMLAVQSSFAELIRQQQVILERIVQRKDGAVAIRSLKEDMAHTRFGLGFDDDNRVIERSERYTAPMQVLRRPSGDAMKVGNDRSPLELGEAGDGQFKLTSYYPLNPDYGRFADQRGRFSGANTETGGMTDDVLPRRQTHFALAQLLSLSERYTKMGLRLN
jgi:hypothetical protein